MICPVCKGTGKPQRNYSPIQLLRMPELKHCVICNGEGETTEEHINDLRRLARALMQDDEDFD